MATVILRFVLLLLVTLAFAADAWAIRRTIRIDGFGSWDEFTIGSSGCPGTWAGSTLVQWSGWTFAGREAPEHLFDSYCQSPAPGTLNELDYGSGDEAVLASFLGENADNAITGLRYSFLDRDRFDFDQQATGFQWMYFFFPDGLTLVGLYGFELETLDSRSYIENGEMRVWDGGLDGYDGEFFCFLGPVYIGVWDGTLADDTRCLSILQRVFTDGFEP